MTWFTTPRYHQLLLTAALLMALLIVVPAAEAQRGGPGAAPQLKKCGKFKKKAPKQRCLKQNKANRVAFNQIKNSRFVGLRGDGQAVESFYCADGSYESRVSGRDGTGVSVGRRWWIGDAVVKQGGKWIDAFLGAPGGYEIALQRRGAQWKVAVASLGRILYPGDVVKSKVADCR